MDDAVIIEAQLLNTNDQVDLQACPFLHDNPNVLPGYYPVQNITQRRDDNNQLCLNVTYKDLPTVTYHQNQTLVIKRRDNQ